MEDDMSRALDIALEYIFLNNLIEERHTLLTGRLVCRAWRASRTFSGKITDVTLHRLADVQLAASYVRRTPHQHLPWRNVEDSLTFPCLNTLRVSEFLSTQLYECSMSRELLASIEQVDVNIFIWSWEWELEHVTRFKILAGIFASIDLKRMNRIESSNWFSDIGNVSALSRLTRLAIDGDIVSSIESFGNLLHLGSLRHLQLSSLTLCHDAELINCFCICAALTQLTRLDISGDVEYRYSYFNGDLRSMGRIINDLAPAALHEFQTWYGPEDNTDSEGCHLLASWTNGILKTERCEIKVGAREEIHRKVAQQLSRVPQDVTSSVSLVINCYCKPQAAEFPLDLTRVASVPELELFIYNCSHLFSNAGEAIDAHQNDNATDSAAVAFSIKPVLMSQQGVQMAASHMKIETHKLGAIDLSHLAPNLPDLFPCLRNLALRACYGGFDHLNYISQLTKLTRLVLCVDTLDLPRFSGPLFPTCLRELDIRAKHLVLPSLSQLEHLTQLQIYSDGCQEGCSLDALYGCTAPLTYLSVQVIKVDLPALVEAFPRLETLKVQVSSFDISPLSSLRLLHTLRAYLPDSTTAVLAGVETLTGLASLFVENASECLDGLRDLAVLTQLRNLTYFVKVPDPCREWQLLWQFERAHEDLLNKYRDLMKQMHLRMPNTKINVFVNSLKIKLQR